MIITIASTNKLEIAACKKAFANSRHHYIPVKTESGVSLQPFDLDTVTGVFNRIAHAHIIVPDADCYVGIQSGVFEENGRYFEKAAVVIGYNNLGRMMKLDCSEPVELPARAVKEARRRENCTIGEVMAEMGLVRLHDDPHFSITGISRKDYIVDALRSLIRPRKTAPSNTQDYAARPSV